jgi:hypothetical protein
MTVEVVDGGVVILGPDGIAAALTPDSADESARRMAAGARRAREPRSFTGYDDEAAD